MIVSLTHYYLLKLINLHNPWIHILEPFPLKLLSREDESWLQTLTISANTFNDGHELQVPTPQPVLWSPTTRYKILCILKPPPSTPLHTLLIHIVHVTPWNVVCLDEGVKLPEVIVDNWFVKGLCAFGVETGWFP